MRKLTKNIVGVISLGVLATSWSIGQAAETGLVVDVVAAPSGSPEPTAQPSSSASTQPTPGSSASPSATASGGATPTTSAKPVSKVSKTGGVITYNVQGYTYQIQLTVTKTGSDISAVVPVIAEATKVGKTDFTVAFKYLNQMALAANSANFSNVGGATYTSTAYKQALESALAKF